MKKAAKKTVKAKAKAKPVAKAKAKAPVKAAKKAKAAPKKKAVPKTKAVAKKSPPAKTKTAVKAKPAGKKTHPVSAKAPVKRKPAAPAAPVVPPKPPAPKLPSSGLGTRENPWLLKTPAGFSEFQAYKEEASDPPAVVVKVGSTELRYHLRCLNDLHEMLKAYGDWMLLGSADEQQPAAEGTVEAWARSPVNPVGGWYGLKAGLRGRFATYVPQVMETLGMAEVEHFPNNNRMRAK